jgi:hypothetical protein
MRIPIFSLGFVWVNHHVLRLASDLRQIVQRWFESSTPAVLKAHKKIQKASSAKHCNTNKLLAPNKKRSDVSDNEGIVTLPDNYSSGSETSDGNFGYTSESDAVVDTYDSD